MGIHVNITQAFPLSLFLSLSHTFFKNYLEKIKMYETYIKNYSNIKSNIANYDDCNKQKFGIRSNKL